MPSAKVVPVGNQFTRLFPVPLDPSLVFSTSLARSGYLTSPATSGVAYGGMIVSDLETNKVYVLGTGMVWQEVGITVNETFGAATSGMLFKTGNNTFSVGGLSSGNNIVITNPSGIAGNPTISLNSSVTGLTNLTSISGIFSNKLAVSGSLTLNGRDITTNIEAIQNTNTANFNLSVGSITDVGSNGGPSYYGTYDQGGNVREIMYSGTSSGVAMRGGNFATLTDADALNKSFRSSQSPSAGGPGYGFRLASRENIGKTYRLNLSAGNSISVSGGIVHNFQIGDPLKFASDAGLPAVVSSGVTYYVVATGSTTFSVGSGVGGAPITWNANGNNSTSTYSSYDYGSFVRVENSGNTADGSYGAVNYNYRIGKFEVTNEEYVEFLNAVARNDKAVGDASYLSSVDMGLYDPLMETEAPNNGISRNAAFPDYYYAPLRGMNKKPVVFVSYVDAARYANWLHNGKPIATRYRSIITTTNNIETTVYLPNHGYVTGDEIVFDCAEGTTFSGTAGHLAKNTKYKVEYLTPDNFQVKDVSNNSNVPNPISGQFYVRKYFDKSLNINSGSYNVADNQTTALPQLSTARYWIPTENEWYKAAYYDPNKNGVGSAAYWNYPTRSDTMPSPISADSNGNGSYNGAGTIPSHSHNSYDISDFVDRIGGILANGSGTQPIYDSTNSTIAVNVTGIPLSTVKDVTATSTEVNYLDLSTGAGTAEASKALVLNSNKAITGITSISSATGIINYISGVTGIFGASNNTNNASTLMVGTTSVSLSGHKHVYTDITNFCSGVASCVDTSLTTSTGIQFNYGANSLGISLSGQSLALHNLNTNGLIVRSGNNTVVSRSITASGSNIWIGDGNGVSGNPTVGLSPDVTLNSLTAGDVTINNNLVVNGTTIIANVDSIVVEDPIMTLGKSSGNIVANTSYDRGIALVLNTGLTAFMGWDTNLSKFVLYSSGVADSVSGTYTAGTWGPIRAGDVEIENATVNTLALFDSSKKLVSFSTGNLVPANRTITPGSGLNGSTGLTLDNDITLNIGTGDGITVSSDTIGVNSTFVRTTGTQSVSGVKTFIDNIVFSSGVTVTGNLNVSGIINGLGAGITGINAASLTGNANLPSGVLPTITFSSPFPATDNSTSLANFINGITVDRAGRVIAATTGVHRDATTTVKGVASFSSDNFDVTSGVVSVKTGGISNTNLANSTITVGSTSISLGGTDTNLAGLDTVTANSFVGSGNQLTDVNAYNLNIYSNTNTDSLTSLVLVTGTSTGNYRPFIDSKLAFNASSNTLILESISGSFTWGGNAAWRSTTISGISTAASPTQYLVNFVIDGGTP